jgi:hypothetical protein
LSVSFERGREFVRVGTLEKELNAIQEEKKQYEMGTFIGGGGGGGGITSCGQTT